jgi:hypothetical protein
MPDEMERIVRVVVCLTGATLRWYYDKGSYTVAFLSHSTVAHRITKVDSKKIEAIRELFEWLKPVHQRALSWVSEHKIAFVV